MGRGSWGWGQTTEVCFDVGLLVCFLLPGPPPERLGPSTVEETHQDGHQQPADKKAADVDKTIGVGGTSIRQTRENLKG